MPHMLKEGQKVLNIRLDPEDVQALDEIKIRRHKEYGGKLKIRRSLFAC